MLATVTVSQVVPVAGNDTVEKVTDTRGDDLHDPEQTPCTAEIT